MQLCRVGTLLPRTRVHMQGSHTKHTCPHARRGGHLAANPKKVPGLTRPSSRRFAWAFAGLGCSAAGMRVSLLPEDELEADADEGGRECLPVVVATTRLPAAGGASGVPFSPRSASVPPADVTTDIVATTAGAAGGGDCGWGGIAARSAALFRALRAALRRWRAFGAFGSTDASSAAAPGTAAAASPSATAGEGGCGWEKERPRRRAVAKAFLSVERSRSSSNSLRAAKRALSSTLHAARGDRRAAKEAIQMCLRVCRI